MITIEEPDINQELIDRIQELEQIISKQNVKISELQQELITKQKDKNVE